MNAPLLQTKLLPPPPRPDAVPRPHLLARLTAGAAGKLTLVAAPAGFGKTTLVREWLAHTAVPAAWLSLDEADNDPVRFWRYAIAALQTAAPAAGAAAADLLRTPQPPPPHAVLPLLLNDLLALSRRTCLVLDDYHLIAHPAVHDSLAFFIDQLPPTLHLVITSRANLPFPVARWRARQQLTELRAADLRFSAAETAVLYHPFDLAPADLAALAQRTEGWIAGLQLAALALRHTPAAARAPFIHAFGGSHAYVLDYLMEEVLAQQPADVRAFLQHTALLGRLSAPLCAAVTGRTPADSANMLAQLVDANLFLLPLDAERRWYRYHRL
ncbi:MAG: hypothetical protein KC413_00405, partial [Anaerolineales bacterium]|nr:hypothetical protein [Anaerolineales bacterium]